MAFPNPERREHDPQFVQPHRRTDFDDVHVKRNASQGFLFCVDVWPRAVVCVRSSREPDWDYAFHNADFLLAAPPQVTSVEPEFRTGDCYRFRLRANPTVKKQDEKHRNGYRAGLVREEDQLKWLRDKGLQQCGFELLEARISPEAKITSRKGSSGPVMTFLAVRFDGLLRVTDPEKFLEAVQSGIGPAKAFGFGLLSLAPAHAGS
jgi:CRISPR system Cascade subunit CasE